MATKMPRKIHVELHGTKRMTLTTPYKQKTFNLDVLKDGVAIDCVSLSIEKAADILDKPGLVMEGTSPFFPDYLVTICHKQSKHQNWEVLGHCAVGEFVWYFAGNKEKEQVNSGLFKTVIEED